MSSLPVKSVDFILGNDLAGGKVMPVIEVVDEPNVFCELEVLSETYPDVSQPAPSHVLSREE